MLIVEKKTGYINATKFCKLNGMDFNDWMNKPHYKKLIELVDIELACTDLHALMFIRGLSDELNGVYVNKLVLPWIISWINNDIIVPVHKLSKPITFNSNEKQTADSTLDKLIKQNNDIINISNDIYYEVSEIETGSVSNNNILIKSCFSQCDNSIIKTNISLSIIEDRLDKLADNIKLLNDNFGYTYS
jgi:hypothetical protein